MNQSQKRTIFISFVLILMLLLAACQTAEKEETGNSEIAVAVALTQTAAAVAPVESTSEPPPPAQVTVATTLPTPVSTTASDATTSDAPASEPSGYIQGIVYMQAPPTPAMMIYALDPATGVWTAIETEASDGASSFTLEIPPGTYQVFTSLGLGYASADGWSLELVTISPGQTVTGIEVRPPSQSECGSMFGLPASPDGQFAEIPGPAEACKNEVMGSTENNVENGRLQPLDDNCTNLQVALEPTLQLPISIGEVAIDNSGSGQSGQGCQLIGLANGNNFENMFLPYDAVKTLLFEHSWVESTQSPCLGHGGAGPGAIQTCFVRGSEICELFVYEEPVDMALCSGIEGPIGECLDTLAPEQIIYTTMLTCAQGLEGADVGVTTSSPSSTPIVFAPDATGAAIHTNLQPDELHGYIFSAQSGQEAMVNLAITTNGVETPANALMDIGVKGYAPLAANVLEWSGALPAAAGTATSTATSNWS